MALLDEEIPEEELFATPSTDFCKVNSSFFLCWEMPHVSDKHRYNEQNRKDLWKLCEVQPARTPETVNFCERTTNHESWIFHSTASSIPQLIDPPGNRITKTIDSCSNKGFDLTMDNGSEA